LNDTKKLHEIELNDTKKLHEIELNDTNYKYKKLF